jgi:mRNA-degrading endonuclease RelE of RelBE toxin-antitoxin system
LISKTTARFKQAFDKLPQSIQRQARQKYKLWRGDSNHPSLHFKLLRGQADLWSIRVGDHYRALGFFEDKNLFIWTWIGTHEQYNKLVKK